MTFLEVYDIVSRGGVAVMGAGGLWLLYKKKLAWYWQVEDERARTTEEKERTAIAHKETLYWRELALRGTGLLTQLAERAVEKGAGQ